MTNAVLFHNLRRWFNNRPKPMILMYHRIAEPRWDPWNLSVSADNFRDQLKVLCHARKVMSMDQFAGALQAGDLPDEALAVTFDDGYFDNFSEAKPIVEEMQVPITVFLSTGNLGARAFWWDDLANMILNFPDPIAHRVEIGGETLDLLLPPNDRDKRKQPFKTIMGRTNSHRAACYYSIWQRLQPLPAPVRESELAILADIFGMPSNSDFGRPMTRDEAKALSSEFVSIGSHAQDHHPLPTMGEDEQRRQVLASKADCLEIAGRQPYGFAFPHGERTRQSSKIVEDTGYHWAVSTQECVVDRDNFDAFNLPRIQVRDYQGSRLLKHLGQY